MKKYLILGILIYLICCYNVFARTGIVGELENPTDITDSTVQIRSNSNRLEFSNDSGSTWYDVLAMTETESTTYDIGSLATTGYVYLDFAGDDALRYDADNDLLEFWDGNSWELVGSGGGPSEFALEGDGTGDLASVSSLSAAGWGTTITDFTFFAVVIADSLTRAESFYKITETVYSENIINFGKTSDEKLTLTIGANTYTSGVVWDSSTIGIPVEVGVACDSTGGTVTFFFAGLAESEQAATFTYPTTMTIEEHVLGDGLDGSMFYLSLVGRELIPQSTFHTPLREGLGQASYWLIHFNMNTGEGTSLVDRVYEQLGSGTDYTMTLTDGSWVEYAQGY